ncbi:hypothetical protein CDS [Bradyrhizobium sp. G22]|nr:hypothetical protein CDS [Bradyrhizobium sp. G22]
MFAGRRFGVSPKRKERQAVLLRVSDEIHCEIGESAVCVKHSVAPSIGAVK